MAGGSLRLVLFDGEALTVEADEVERLYENLWRLAPKRGAVALAGVLAAASRDRAAVLGGRAVELSERETVVIREAIEMPASDA